MIKKMYYDLSLKNKIISVFLILLTVPLSITFFTIVLLIIAGTMSAYALTFIKARANGTLAAVITLGYFIPPGSVQINAFLILKSLNLANSFAGIVVVYGFLFTPITMIILVGYMKTIPFAIIESATIDGADHFTAYWRIILPMVKSALVTLGHTTIICGRLSSWRARQKGQ